jgi:hypothetical protein
VVLDGGSNDVIKGGGNCGLRGVSTWDGPGLAGTTVLKLFMSMRKPTAGNPLSDLPGSTPGLSSVPMEVAINTHMGDARIPSQMKLASIPFRRV